MRLHCHSPERAEKENAILERRSVENDAVARQAAHALDKVHERLGRLKAATAASPDTTTSRSSDESGSARRRFGVPPWPPTPACLRTNVGLGRRRAVAHLHHPTDLEAVFRSLKSELGLRPIHHRKPVRAEGFITVVAYQAVVIRRRLAAAGERASWTTLRNILGGQRVTATFRRTDGRTLHLRRTRTEGSTTPSSTRAPADRLNLPVPAPLRHL